VRTASSVSFCSLDALNTVLICVEPDGTAKVVADRIGFPNGMVLTPDGRTLIVAESTMNRLSAFNVALGSFGERRTWAAFGDPPASTDVGEMFGQVAVVPDGICLDAEGAVWVPSEGAHANSVAGDSEPDSWLRVAFCRSDPGRNRDISGSIPGSGMHGSANQQVGLRHWPSLTTWGFRASYRLDGLRPFAKTSGPVYEKAVYR
jgi:hypothetical protein